MQLCDTPWCGKEARYIMYMSVEVWDTQGQTCRKKSVKMALCEQCEKATQKFFARDAAQRSRIANAITSSNTTDHMVEKLRRRGFQVSREVAADG